MRKEKKKNKKRVPGEVLGASYVYVSPIYLYLSLSGERNLVGCWENLKEKQKEKKERV